MIELRSDISGHVQMEGMTGAEALRKKSAVLVPG